MLPPIKSCRDCERNSNERFGFFLVFEQLGKHYQPLFPKSMFGLSRSTCPRTNICARLGSLPIMDFVTRYTGNTICKRTGRSAYQPGKLGSVQVLGPTAFIRISLASAGVRCTTLPPTVVIKTRIFPNSLSGIVK